MHFGQPPQTEGRRKWGHGITHTSIFPDRASRCPGGRRGRGAGRAALGPASGAEGEEGRHPAVRWEHRHDGPGQSHREGPGGGRATGALQCDRERPARGHCCTL
jgi:hypothetical protein